jgi:hypothetical protein
MPSSKAIEKMKKEKTTSVPENISLPKDYLDNSTTVTMLTDFSNDNTNKTLHGLTILQLLGLLDSCLGLVLADPLEGLFEIVVGLDKGLLGLHHGDTFDGLANLGEHLDVGLDSDGSCAGMAGDERRGGDGPGDGRGGAQERAEHLFVGW